MTTHTFRSNPTPPKHVPKRLPVIVAEYWSGITMLALILQLQVYLWWVRVALVAEEAHGTHDKGFATLGPYTQLLVRRALSVFVS
ncbi:hypothetical protein F4815DRAFT_453630 [Daldinia loculata]|nr:hypothetical protein F4815DRAFT_453630 [Daldinia loculata]